MLTEAEVLEKFMINLSAAVIKRAKDDAIGHGFSQATHEKRLSYGEIVEARAFLASISGPPRLKSHLSEFCSSLQPVIDDRILVSVSEVAPWFPDYIKLLKDAGISWRGEAMRSGFSRTLISNIVHGKTKFVTRDTAEKLLSGYMRISEKCHE